MFRFKILCVTVALGSISIDLTADDSFFRENDRIVFLGNTLIEREQKTGYWETELQTSFPALNLTVRNLGWDGDTVWADSRGIFDPPAAGYQRMIELVNELKPTVIVMAYGGVEAFPDETRRPEFESQYRKLMSDLGSTNARFVHVSPMLMEYKSFPVQSSEAQQHVEQYNQNAMQLSEIISRIAESTSGRFVDLIACQQAHPELTWTQNGLHLTPAAYAATGQCLVKGLGGTPTSTDSDATARKIREVVIEKNRLFFHRWRPQNITYLLGFRKHEQGNNAVEIAQFDPLVADLEARIRMLLQSK